MHCEIQWVDTEGHSTPDQNDAVGFVYLRAHVSTILHSWQSTTCIPTSQMYPICAEHLRTYFADNLQAHHWRFIPMLPDIA